jgi:PIN domain nuclease of toxin-antitoxin system
VTEVVLDASAVIALINEEPGAEVVDAVLDDAVISAVNLSEVIAVLIDAGFEFDRARAMVRRIGLPVIAFDEPQGLHAGGLRATTRAAGLSLGDRACLCLAEQRDAAALTAHRRWATLSLTPEIRLIR